VSPSLRTEAKWYSLLILVYLLIQALLQEGLPEI
jgi:hypothetical protein